jgi:hypothetical protein
MKVKALFFQGDCYMYSVFDDINLNIGTARNYLPVLSVEAAWSFVEESYRHFYSSRALRDSPMDESYTLEHLDDLFSELYGYEYDSSSNVGEDAVAVEDQAAGDGMNVETENQEEDVEVDEEAADESDEDYQDEQDDESEDVNDEEMDQDANKITIKPQKKNNLDFISAYSKKHSMDDRMAKAKHYAMDVDLSMGVTYSSSCDCVLRTGYIKTREDEKLIAPYEWANGKISRNSVLKPSDPNYYQINGRAKKVWQPLQTFEGQPGHMDYTTPITCLTDCHMTGSFK